MTLLVNETRIREMIEALEAYTATPGCGTTRPTYSNEHRDALTYLKAKMEEAGLTTRIDAVGNLFGRLEGQETNLAPVLVGSHIDSVPNGGAFDGPAGVIAGIETAFTFSKLGTRPRRPIEFVAMIEEEGSRFGGGLLGSRLLTGQVSQELLDGMADQKGLKLAEAMSGFGLDPSQALDVAIPVGGIHAFLELHIEQGPLLERNAEDVGIVTSVVSLSQLEVRVTGVAGHAGTTPMAGRKDALVAAAGLIARLPEIVGAVDSDAVATVGRMDVRPGGANVIPDSVEFSIDVRAANAETVETIKARIREDLSSLEKIDFVVATEDMIMIPQTPMSHMVREAFIAAAEEIGLKWRDMASGAGHDAMILSKIAPVGLIFVPSRDGISHTPEEWTDYDQLARGIEVVFRAARALSA